MSDLPGLIFNHWITQDLLLIGSFALVFFLLSLGARNERWQRAWIRLKHDRTGLIAFGVICLYLLIGALEYLQIPVKNGRGGTQTILDAFTSHIRAERSYSAPLAEKPLYTTRDEKLAAPRTHLLGTDVLGKDVFVEALKACRTALIIGGLTTAIYIPVGTLLGIMAGYFRRWVDDLIQYAYSTLASIPEILLLVAFLLVRGKGLGNISLALWITGWVGLCRLIRGETMRQSERPYVMAARALGQTHWNIITRHLLPNVMHLVLISAILGFSNIVLAEAILSYLGVGVPVGTPSWGAMIDNGRSELSREPFVWWNITTATVALFGLVLSLNILGDSLRRAFDPKTT
jgi:peptide/nickel transport system permease protein